MSERRELHQFVERVLDARAYLVGGSVRDGILGLDCDDWDFTTKMLPDAIEAAVRAAGRKPILTGKRHGTIMFKTPDGRHKIEVTSHRTEVYEDGSRQPVAKFGVSLNEDLYRRDFTVNALARRASGRVVDPFNGRADLADRILRTPGPAKRTFNEDPIRILRGARFVAKFGMNVDRDTEKAMADRAHRILMPATERSVTELDKLLALPDPSAGLYLLSRTRVLNFVLPEIAIQVDYDQNSKYHCLPLWDHTVSVVSRINRTDVTSMSVDTASLGRYWDDPKWDYKELALEEEEFLCRRWAALLHDIAKPQTRTLNKKSGYHNYIKHDLLGARMAEAVCWRLKMSGARIARVSSLVESHLLESSPLKEADDAAK